MKQTLTWHRLGDKKPKPNTKCWAFIGGGKEPICDNLNYYDEHTSNVTWWADGFIVTAEEDDLWTYVKNPSK